MSVIFPKWLNALPTFAAIGGLGGAIAVVGGVWYYATPEYWEVGYMPTQPGGGFNHQIHAGKLGIDCRYCHTNVERSPEANIPSVSTCFGCHAEGHVAPTVVPDYDAKVKFVRDAYLGIREGTAEVVEGGESIPWKRVHKLPDYVRNFPHDVHVNAGVSCFTCHGQITGMPVVAQARSLSMSWCLDCHRKVGVALATNTPPTDLLVPRDKVTRLRWVEDEWLKAPEATEAAKLLEAIKTAPPDNCGACHY